MKEKTIEELERIAQDRILYSEGVRTEALLELARRKALRPELYELYNSHIESQIAYHENEANDRFSPDSNIVDDPALPALYSKKAILEFGILFTILPSTILLWVNLKTLDKSEEGRLLIPIGLLISFLAFYFFSKLSFPDVYIGLGINAIFGVFILEYYWRKYIGVNFKHRRRGIILPLIACIAILISIFITLIKLK